MLWSRNDVRRDNDTAWEEMDEEGYGKERHRTHCRNATKKIGDKN